MEKHPVALHPSWLHVYMEMSILFSYLHITLKPPALVGSAPPKSLLFSRSRATRYWEFFQTNIVLKIPITIFRYVSEYIKMRLYCYKCFMKCISRIFTIHILNICLFINAGPIKCLRNDLLFTLSQYGTQTLCLWWRRLIPHNFTNSQPVFKRIQSL